MIVFLFVSEVISPFLVLVMSASSARLCCLTFAVLLNEPNVVAFPEVLKSLRGVSRSQYTRDLIRCVFHCSAVANAIPPPFQSAVKMAVETIMLVSASGLKRSNGGYLSSFSSG